jgi:hypothetical protein
VHDFLTCNDEGRIFCCHRQELAQDSKSGFLLHFPFVNATKVMKTSSVILLTDADGVILESFGAQRYIDYAAQRNLHAARAGSFYLLLKQKGSICELD